MYQRKYKIKFKTNYLDLTRIYTELRYSRFLKFKIFYRNVKSIGEFAFGLNPKARIDKLKGILNIVPLSEKICLEGSKIKYEMRRKRLSKFSLFDGIILASAQSINQKLLTIDQDFKKAKDVILI